MSRWAPNARERLERAAIDLFTEQGFAATTVPQITARAGLTTRTFFRYFADKREVLFAGDEIPEWASRLLAEAPADLDPIALIAHGLRVVAETRFDDRREEVRVLRSIIRSDDGLLERDLRKRAALAEAIRRGLITRGTEELQAALLADATVTVLHVALDHWLDHKPDQPLSVVVLDVLGTYGAVLSPRMALAGATVSRRPAFRVRGL